MGIFGGFKLGPIAAASALVLASPSYADTINWASLTSTTAPSGTVTVDGHIDVNGTTVNTTFNGTGVDFVQINNSGTNYWVDNHGDPNAFVANGVNYAPTQTDIIALDGGGLKTITFDQAVSNVYLALVSWNGNSGTFDQSFNVFSQGCGYWGCGSFTNVTPTSFVSDGELHGIMQFTGTFNQITFTDNTEGWHGILVGIAGLAPTAAVPEAATWAMMILGMGAIGFAMRRGKVATRVSYTA